MRCKMTVGLLTMFAFLWVVINGAAVLPVDFRGPPSGPLLATFSVLRLNVDLCQHSHSLSQRTSTLRPAAECKANKDSLDTGYGNSGSDSLVPDSGELMNLNMPPEHRSYMFKGRRSDKKLDQDDDRILTVG